MHGFKKRPLKKYTDEKEYNYRLVCRTGINNEL